MEDSLDMLLSIEKYQSDIEERQRRLAIAKRFEEPDRVPVAFGVAGSYFCWLFGVNIRDYYMNPALQVETQLKGIEWEYEFLRADSCTRSTIHYDPGPIQEAVVFGGEIERPDNTSPRIVKLCRTLDEVLALDVPRPEDNPRFKEQLARAERFGEAAQKMGVKIPATPRTGMSIHPPLSCVCALMDPGEVCLAMYTEPERLKRALDKCFDAFLMYGEVGIEDPSKLGRLGLADDNISFISSDSFRKFEMPYYLKLKKRYNAKFFRLHTDGPNDQHFKVLADEVGLNEMDIGGFSQLENAVRDMKGKVYIHGGLNCKDFYAEGPMTDATRKRVLQCIKLAAPGGGYELAIGGECYVKVSPKGIRDCVKLVEERGRYPIDISEDEIA